MFFSIEMNDFTNWPLFLEDFHRVTAMAAATAQQQSQPQPQLHKLFNVVLGLLSLNCINHILNCFAIWGLCVPFRLNFCSSISNTYTAHAYTHVKSICVIICVTCTHTFAVAASPIFAQFSHRKKFTWHVFAHWINQEKKPQQQQHQTGGKISQPIGHGHLFEQKNWNFFNHSRTISKHCCDYCRRCC